MNETPSLSQKMMRCNLKDYDLQNEQVISIKHIKPQPLTFKRSNSTLELLRLELQRTDSIRSLFSYRCRSFK